MLKDLFLFFSNSSSSRISRNQSVYEGVTL